MPEYKISHYNGTRGENELVIYDKGQRTETNKYGFEACVLRGRVISLGGNDNTIPQGGFVISGHGNAAIFVSEEICVGARAYIEGDHIKIETDEEALNISAEEKISSIIGRKEILDKKQEAYQSHKVEQLISLAKSAKEKKNFREVARIYEEAYYLTAETKKDEIRAVWHRPIENNHEEVDATLSKFADAGINIMLIETNYGGYANALKCVAEYLPPMEKYKDGFDVIESFIRQGKKHGISIHAWIENFFVGHSGAECPLANIHPDWMACRKDGGLLLDGYDNFYFINPAIKEVREFLLALCKELLDKYDFDGLQLDYIRYPAIRSIDRAAGFDETSKAMFFGETGINIDNIESTHSEEWKKYVYWCADKISEYVRTVYELIQEYRKNGRYICLSTAVVGDPQEALLTKCQDWGHWLEQGWLDAIYPMAYYNDAAEVEKEIEYMVNHYENIPNISGISPMYNKLPLIETTKQVEACRRAGAKGIAMFSAGCCSDEELEKLKIGVYRK